MLSGAVGVLVCLVVPAVAFAAGPVGSFDVNGDGFADLVVGSQDNGYAGAVNVLPGSSTGPTATGSQLWSLDSSGVKGTAGPDEIFGAVVASGDFDGDGRADLAIGAPQKTVGGEREAGTVSVLYGTAKGLTARRDQLWSQRSRGVPGSAENGDHFGASLSSADLDGDGYSDLAIGVPGESNSIGFGVGLVNVLYGSRSGLRSRGAQAWTQASKGVRGSTESDDEFGSSLASGDVDGDGYADLAVGVPGDNVAVSGENVDAGAVQLLLGSRKGLTARGSQLWSQDSAGVLDTSEDYEEFGASLAMGDFNRDGRSDVAVGVPYEVVQNCETCSSQGAVQVLLGTPDGFTSADNAFFHIGDPGLPGDVSDVNELGDAVAAGDFDGDGAADLAVTAPGARVGNQPGAGAVYILTGSNHGLRANGLVITQNITSGPGSAEADEGSGMSLAAHRYAGGTRDSLAIGFPSDNVGSVHSAGAVVVVPGSANGLAPASSRLWSQDSPGIEGTAEELDQFGHVGDDEQ